MIHVKGDIWDIAKIAAQAGPIALGHGVNCRGVMGAGIALSFKQRFPEMFTNYVNICEVYPPPALLGKCTFTAHNLDKHPIWVTCLFTQEHPGPDAQYDYVDDAVRSALAFMDTHPLTGPLIIPMIGAGIGGLDPSVTLDLFDQYDDRLVVVEYDK